MRIIQAVIFDYDGVIANTMEDNYRSWRYAFSQKEIILSKEEFFSFEGLRPLELAEAVCQKYGIPKKNASDLVSVKEDYFINHCSPPIYKGVEELLIKLKKSTQKIGLVTVGSRIRIYKTTPKKILSLFDVIVTGNDIKKPKPDPEGYLKAIKSLNIRPSEAMIVEDTKLGIASAKSAGASCIGVCSTREMQSLKQADIIVENFADIDPILMKLLNTYAK